MTNITELISNIIEDITKLLRQTLNGGSGRSKDSDLHSNSWSKKFF